MFLQTRWVEDEFVAFRATDVWQFIVSVAAHQSLSTSKRPENNKSYNLSVQYVTDNLMDVKIQFFKEIASMLSSYLNRFQTIPNAPTLPIASDVLEGKLRQFMKMVLRRSVVDEADTLCKLIQFDLGKEENSLP